MSASDSFTGRLRYSLRLKRKPRSFRGLLRMWWHDFALHPLGHGTECCEDCGDWQFPIWHSPDELWPLVSTSGGFGGLLCPRCFAERAERIGVDVCFDARLLRSTEATELADIRELCASAGCTDPGDSCADRTLCMVEELRQRDVCTVRHEAPEALLEEWELLGSQLSGCTNYSGRAALDDARQAMERHVRVHQAMVGELQSRIAELEAARTPNPAD